MTRLIGLGFCAFMASVSATAQSWQLVHTPASSYYTMASTKNGYVFAHKPNELLMSPTGQGPFSAVATNLPATSNSAQMYSWKQKLFMKDLSFGFMRSLDYGITWQSLNASLGADSNNLETFIPMSESHAIILGMAGGGGNALVTADTGKTWTKKFSVPVPYVFLDAVVKGSDWYLFSNTTVYKSSDNGQNWTDLNTVSLPYGMKVWVLADGTFITGNGIDIYTSADAITWSHQTSSGIPADRTVGSLFKSPTSDTLFATAANTTTYVGGVYISTDRGASWSNFDAGLPANNMTRALMIAHNGYIFTSALNDGIYRTLNPITASTVGIGKLNKENALFRLFPNPATNRLTLAYTCTGSSTIKIADVTGRVLTTQEITASTGTQTHELNIEALAPAVYTVNVVTENDVLREKFVKQ